MVEVVGRCAAGDTPAAASVVAAAVAVLVASIVGAVFVLDILKPGSNLHKKRTCRIPLNTQADTIQANDLCLADSDKTRNTTAAEHPFESSAMDHKPGKPWILLGTRLCIRSRVQFLRHHVALNTRPSKAAQAQSEPGN